MRCENCNTDLPESYKACPLCGGKPTESEYKLDGIAYVPYPTSPTPEPQPCQRKKTALSLERLKAYFNL